MTIHPFDDRRDIIIAGSQDDTISFCVKDFIRIANEAIKARGLFSVALSGGSTPHAIFERLAKKENAGRIAWDKVLIFWSDERSVPPEDPESNYRMAFDSGLRLLPIPPSNIYRMKAESNIQENAAAYEELIKKNVPAQTFDLIMLGMGDDGHTASLFPHTEGLDVKDHAVIANYIPQKKTWRMTFTFAQIHKARNIRLYVIGAKKAEMLNKVLHSPFQPHELPSQAVGTSLCKSLWVADQAAASTL